MHLISEELDKGHENALGQGNTCGIAAMTDKGEYGKNTALVVRKDRTDVKNQHESKVQANGFPSGG